MKILSSYRLRSICYFACLSLMLGHASRINADELSKQTLSLKQAIELTMQHSPVLTIFTVKNQMLSLDHQIAMQGPAKQINAELENAFGSGDLQSISAAELSVSLSSVIELGDKRLARGHIVSAHQSQLAIQKQISSLDLLTELSLVYIDTLTLQQQIQLAEDTLALSERHAQKVLERNQSGLVPDADLQRAQIAVREADYALSALHMQHQQLRQHLASFWGEQQPQFKIVSGDLFRLGKLRQREQLIAALNQQPDLSYFISQQRINQAEQALAKANATADWQWSLGLRYLNESDDIGLIAGFSVPLGQSSRSIPAIQKTQLLDEQARLNQEQAYRDLYRQVDLFYSQHQQALLAINSLQTHIIPLREQVFQTTQQGYLQGLYSYLDVISARQALLVAKARLINYASESLKNAAQIERLTGITVFANATPIQGKNDE